MLGACCPLGIAAQVPGTERRPGFASTGFPVSFAGSECSCRAAGLGTGAVGPGTAGTPHRDTETREKSQFGSPHGGYLGDIAEDSSNPCERRESDWSDWDGQSWGQRPRGWRCRGGASAGDSGDSGDSSAEGAGIAAQHLLQPEAWPQPRAINSWHRSPGQSRAWDSPGC